MFSPVSISHNLAVVEYVADQVAIMYLGRIVELADTVSIFSRPQHPYTQTLIADAPHLESSTVAHRPVALPTQATQWLSVSSALCAGDTGL